MPVPMEGVENTYNSPTVVQNVASDVTLPAPTAKPGKKNKVMKALKRVSGHMSKTNLMEEDDTTKNESQQNGKELHNDNESSSAVTVTRSASFDGNNNSDDTASENSLSVSYDSRSSVPVQGSLSDSNLKLSQSQGQTSLKSRFSALSPVKKRSGSSSSSKSGRPKFLTQILPGISTRSKFELFKKVFNLPDGEQPIADFACALHRDILVQGRVYLTQNWVCFYANIFRWETLVTMKWEDIIAITKEKTVRVIPNALKICTSTDKYVFSSFASQKHAYTAMFRVWQNVLLGQPLGPSELHALCTRITKRRNTAELEGEPLQDEAEETADEATEAERMMFDEQSVTASELSQENSNDVLLGDMNSPRDASVSSGEGQLGQDIPKTDGTPPDTDPEQAPLLFHSISYGGNVIHPPIDIPYNQTNNHKKTGPSPSPLAKRAENFFNIARRKKKAKYNASRPAQKLSRLDIPDNSSLGDTTDGDEGGTSEDELDAGPDEVCACINNHEGKERINKVFPVDVDTLKRYIFAEDSDVIRQVYKDRGICDVSWHAKENESDGSTSRLVTYTVALNYAVGPKSSQTDLTERYNADNRPGQCYVVATEAVSHGVPYADKFRVHTTYCLTRCRGNRSRLVIHSLLKYTGHVFGPIKGMIGKNAEDAMKNYFNSLDSALDGKCGEVPREKTAYSPTPKPDAVKTPGKPSAVPETEVPDTVSYSSSLLSFTSSFRFIAILTIVFLALLCMNSYLYIRLHELERITFAMDEQELFGSKGPQTDAEWRSLLAMQKQVHRADILQMKELIGSTVKLMQQVEGSVSKLYSDIDHLTSSRRPLHANLKADDSPETPSAA